MQTVLSSHHEEMTVRMEDAGFEPWLVIGTAENLATRFVIHGSLGELQQFAAKITAAVRDAIESAHVLHDPPFVHASPSAPASDVYAAAPGVGVAP